MVCFSSQFCVQKSKWQGLGIFGHIISMVRKEEGMHAAGIHKHSPFLHTPGSLLAYENALFVVGRSPTYCVTSVTLVKVTLHVHPQKPISKVILTFVKLIIRTSHHIYCSIDLYIDAFNNINIF